MRHKLALTSAALSTVALLAGCGSGSDTTDTSKQPATSSVNMHGAPKVQEPLDTEAFQQKPCSTLKPAQLRGIKMGSTKGESDDSTGGPSCEWTDRFTGPSDSTIQVTYMVNGAGLKYVYQQKDVFEYFRELPPIQGYPAVAGSSLAPQTPTPEKAGSCDVHVGVTNDLVVLTQITLGDESPYQDDPCGRARDVATEVVKTLKAGA